MSHLKHIAAKPKLAGVTLIIAEKYSYWQGDKVAYSIGQVVTKISRESKKACTAVARAHYASADFVWSWA